ncbi:hypothetical protein [Acrocarpospora pleiomorpha]
MSSRTARFDPGHVAWVGGARVLVPDDVRVVLVRTAALLGGLGLGDRRTEERQRVRQAAVI